MPTPTDRRIIFSSYVIPKKEYPTVSTEETREEGSTVGVAAYDKYLLNTTVGKIFGGKGIASITEDQNYEGWASFYHPGETWDTIDDNWNLSYIMWDGEDTITSAQVIREDSGNINFLYIKNTGATNDLEVSLDGTNYYLLIPPGGALSLRPNDTAVSDIKVQCGSGTTIEYVIAI